MSTETTAVVVSIGNELTSGQTVDTNSAYVSRQLAAIGIEVIAHITVDDQMPRIVAALRRAIAMADAVVISGGLGPTPDDLTRAALAEVMGVELELRGDCLAMIEAFFAKRGWKMNDANRVQALCPVGAEVLDNPVGTAPGIRASVDGKSVFVAPGVPFELRHMMDRHIVPALSELAGGRRTVFRKVNCFGMGESGIGELIADYMARDASPLVGTTAAGGIVGVRITATGSDADEALRSADAMAEKVRRRLGEAVFGQDDETLAAVVGRRLAQRGQTLAVAESCTGGMLGQMITEVPGSSGYFLGGVIAYANEIKQAMLGVPAGMLEEHGAVSEPVAAAMAAGARERFGSDYALALTGIAGPGGGTEDKPVGLVYTALASADGVRVTHTIFGGVREFVRLRSAFAALNMLRLKLT